MTTPTTYEATFRNVPYALIGLGVLVAVLIAIIAAALMFMEQDDAMLYVIFGALGAFLVAVLFHVLSIFRVHRWTIESNGVRIEERQKIPFTGFPRRAFVSFSDIAALRHVESGLDVVYEIAARDGQVYRQMKPQAQQVQKTGEASLESFTAQISKGVAGTGHAPPPISEGLSYWNTLPGLGFIGVLQVLSIALAVVVAWGIIYGEFDMKGRNASNGAAFAVGAPFAVAFFLYRAVARRRRVLSGQK